MKQEEKELLLKDLCARLPYGVKCKVGDNDTRTLVGVSYETNGEMWFKFGLLDLFYETHKPIPYLRPMSSMTWEEQLQEEAFALGNVEGKIDFYNSRHLDYRGLIPKGLALEAEEGMYKLE